MNDPLAPDTALALLGANNAGLARATETLKNTADAKRLHQLEDASEDFEAVFLAEMMKPMFETVDVDPFFGGGKGEEIFRSFLVQEYGKILAGTGTVGISQEVKKTLIGLQGQANGTSLALHNITLNSEESK